MTENKLNNMDVKRNNRSRVYHLLYEHGPESLKNIAGILDMSMPTLLQNVKELKAENLIMDSGVKESTGGRRPKVIGCNFAAKVSVGLDITRNHAVFMLIDLKGNILQYRRIRYTFKNEKEYFDNLVIKLEDFLEEWDVERSTILGVGISLPGIIDADSKYMMVGKVLDFDGGDLDEFRSRIPYPCLFSNDANAGGFAELWRAGNLENVIYLSLSNTVGGAILINGQNYYGETQKGGEFGHLIIKPGGKACYCGRRGCVNAYCSATNLRLGEETLEDFFRKLAKGEEIQKKVWDEYKEYLVLTILNLRTSFDCDIILGGYVGSFLGDYVEEIAAEVQKNSLFCEEVNFIKTCYYQYESSAVGAALMHVKEFVSGI
ncbi:Making large colonies protein [[Eubacterium] contortum]|uniref:Making large colonies protein n=1 Tax=Faecalicatena contorta TaxID=39482 RepID=A0A174H4A6_9FIRM|nr:ROK family transcriptional regulator [Faecalicatena contorta]CUO68058.1 Making large colonies protein [[Eubacterium] contortum] [Faecalicatena contorta]